MAYRTKVCDQGGIFNVARSSAYSAETRTFVNELIKESRLTTLQRKSLQGWLRTGSSPPSRVSQALSSKSKESVNDIIKRYHSSKPRTLQNIIDSGAYEPQAYVSDMTLKNYNAEKEKLQSIMAYGKITKLDPLIGKKSAIKRTSKEECTEEELIDSVILEIEDREKFLYDMESLGQGYKYSPSIIHEIVDRIKKLEAFVSKMSSGYRLADVREISEKYRRPLGSPKTLPTSISII
ncbi:Uncharacterised protein family UPF0193 [Cinara cedri]|uniref:Uncharacterized protein n=1 Tax=Cinara cedri TaxID=506608 RepID=A0A5E4M6S9_9HEMI|nr:Uncharacterised protein family UPF0193 [Cinara cedri]